jgi:hypothetical protein
MGPVCGTEPVCSKLKPSLKRKQRGFTPWPPMRERTLTEFRHPPDRERYSGSQLHVLDVYLHAASTYVP